ncbi:MAG: 4'-phosphopantetheinyl transferase superfamily protein [Desulfobacterales bacterium]|nr:4'-phosphopantetheinyl transferase superfamily protein [Desulfobacterales bacterium]
MGLKNKSDTIFPVILAVPETDRRLKGREKTIALSGYARRALELSSQKNGIILAQLLKEENGAPLPFSGNHWSLSHKSAYVGGVAAGFRIGIDIERIRPIQKALYRRTATDDEWRLSSEAPLQLFFRYWTAKEAVLKAAAIGLKDLTKCRIGKVLDEHHLIVDYLDKPWLVAQVFFDGHVAAVVSPVREVQWTLVTENGRQSRITTVRSITKS